jgi:acetyl-CoA C-acetyltransferase
MVYLTGYGFPIHRGGPMLYADQVGLFNVMQAMKRFQQNPRDDAAFWEPAPLIQRLVAEGKTFNLTRQPSRPNPERPTMTNASHRLHRPHAPDQELEGRFQHDARRHAGRPCRQARRAARGHRPAAIEDVLMGCANPEGATGANIARQIALMADLPITVSGATVNRFCSSGLQTIAMVSQRVIAGEGDVYVAGGVESISCVQQEMNQHMLRDLSLDKKKPEIYWSMLQTAEQVAKRYNIGATHGRVRRASQQKACAALAAGRFEPRSRPSPSRPAWPTPSWACAPRKSPSARTKACAKAPPRKASAASSRRCPGGVITAGNASQFSDGAGACVVVSEDYASRNNLKPIGRFLGFAVAGCEPDEMGIGPVFAIPKVLKKLGLKVSDIDLWELNEAFAVQVIYCRDKLGIPNGPPERRRRRHRRRPPLRRLRPAPDRPRPHRRQAPRRQARRRHHVRRRRHGGGRGFRSSLSESGQPTQGREWNPAKGNIHREFFRPLGFRRPSASGARPFPRRRHVPSGPPSTSCCTTG